MENIINNLTNKDIEVSIGEGGEYIFTLPGLENVTVSLKASEEEVIEKLAHIESTLLNIK